MENQQQFLDAIKHTIIDYNINLTSIPILKILLFVLIIVITQASKHFFLSVIIRRLELLASEDKTSLDDELIEILKQPTGWLILLAGLWVGQLILAPELGVQITQLSGKIINFLAISIGAYIVYHVSPLLGKALRKFAASTETELDNLLLPYLPKLFQVAAILVVVIKASEILLGASASALIGLLGGAGVAFGLLIKDVIYDWFCTVIIFLDKLYQPGDRLIIAGIDGFANVLEIGLRSTKLRVAKWNSIQKIPNSKMITGIVENWTQNPSDKPSYGLNFTLKIDKLSAEQSAIIYQALQEIPKTIDLVSPNCQVRLQGIEANARVFRLRTFTDDFNKYHDAEAAINLAIIQMLEKQSIEELQVSLLVEIDKY
ncbi:mechanosensitive ion channel protein MscL [Dulcicalothrix desertica PCC 7102]|uniref:Mechanosensitive ion channel protein MscL n=1 Tax=Dulcicalothrix desertica PCC 7102 TaxID=232991 RepID=A0A433VLX4_9CYAN|nr:mechanosensitive ion channel domain-containing protein [Dulcicalothrix desertica]RUT07114.1 mechanosensitive ion channel protein MscL [Dulcicalothrix desertica PCC 7102]TWH61889.1 MscS family membrane protein [Dulcicalothrix desertica PCC 7102]